MLRKIKNKEAKICVIGLGYIGLPVASFFAANGYKVVGYDLSKKRIGQIRAGDCPIDEPGFDEIFQKALGNFEVSDDNSILEGNDIFIVCVQTPVKDSEPNLKFLESAVEMVSGHLKDGNILIIESTVPPGTTKRLWEKYGKDNCFVAHCPERVMPGKLVEEFVENARVVGGMANEEQELAKALYSSVIKGEITATDLTTAEIIKVIENTYRNTNIALANEIAVVCDKLGINAFRAIEIANKHPRVHVHTPGCGVGGNCVPVAPILLTHGFDAEHSVVKEGILVNEGMPKYLTAMIKEKLGAVKGKKIILLGYSYKPNSPDVNMTPVAGIIKELDGADVHVFDPFVQTSDIKELDNFYNECKGAECLVLATGHTIFKGIDFGKVKKVMARALLIDGRGFYSAEKMEEEGFEYDGIGI